MFDKGLAASDAIALEQWRHRPLHLRVKELTSSAPNPPSAAYHRLGQTTWGVAVSLHSPNDHEIDATGSRSAHRRLPARDLLGDGARLLAKRVDGLAPHGHAHR